MVSFVSLVCNEQSFPGWERKNIQGNMGCEVEMKVGVSWGDLFKGSGIG